MRQFHDQPPNIEAALQYASRHGWAVLPMREKKFYTRDGVRIATRDPNTIKQWGWAENFGMACGEPSRTDVLDVDDVEAFAAVGFDLDPLTASTLAATTPSGGRHLFFEFAGLRSRVFPWGEWRSTGLAVVLPPAPGRKWLNDVTPQPAPPELIELVEHPIKSRGGFSSFPLLVATSDELPKAIYKALLRAMPLGSVLCRRHQRWAGSILRKLIAYRDGRNAALMRATFDFRPIIADGLIAEADARSLLVMACSANGYLGKVGIGQVNATISWALEPLEERRSAPGFPFFFLPPGIGLKCFIVHSQNKQNTIIAQITLDYPIKQSASGCTGMQWGEPKQMETTMFKVQIGKGIEMEVDTSRLNDEVRDHILRTGLRNLLMDAHASATAKADPEGYLKKSGELAEKKLASLYAGVVRAHSIGGPKAPTDPVAMVILRLARKAVISRPEVAAASKAGRLALINKLASSYAAEHDAQLRPRAQKIVALEEGEPVQAKHEPMPTKKKKAA